MNSSSTIKSFLIGYKTIEQNGLSRKIQCIITVITRHSCKVLLEHIPVFRDIHTIRLPELKIPVRYLRFAGKKLFCITINRGNAGGCFYAVEINLIRNQTGYIRRNIMKTCVRN